MSRWAILGSGGCFGTNLAKHLLDEGYEIVGIGRNPRKPECFSLGVEYPYHTYHIGHELDYVMDVLEQFHPDIIVNFAAQGEGAASFNHHDYWRFYQTNCVALVRLTGRLALQLPYLNWQRFIHIGTSELYGSVEEPSKETDPILPTSPYAASKAGFDMHLQAINRTLGFAMNIIRPSNCIVEGQQLHRIVPKTFLYGLTGRKIPLHGGGNAKKSYLHADDLSRAIMLVAEKAPVGEIFNVGPDNTTPVKRIVELCARCLEMPADELYQIVGERRGQDGAYWLNSDKIKSLGWEQKVSLMDGLRRVHDWVKKYLPELSKLDDNFRMRA